MDTGLDRVGWSACESFFGAVFGIGGPEHAYNLSVPKREQIVQATAGGRQSSVKQIESATAVLDGNVDRSQQAWRQAVNKFTTTCSDNGWDATR